MSVPESAPGLAVDWAWATITAHAERGGCNGCRGSWCPTAEWSLGVVITDHLIPDSRRQFVTVVARQVMTAHWPQSVDGCRPCGLPECGRAALAAAWLESHHPGFVAPRPSLKKLREITGMGGPGTETCL